MQTSDPPGADLTLERVVAEPVEPERSGVVRVRRPRFQTTPATPLSIIEELRKAGRQKPSS